MCQKGEKKIFLTFFLSGSNNCLNQTGRKQLALFFVSGGLVHYYTVAPVLYQIIINTFDAYVITVVRNIYRYRYLLTYPQCCGAGAGEKTRANT